MPNRHTLPPDRFGSLPSGHTTPPDRCAPPSLTVTPRAPQHVPPPSTKPPAPSAQPVHMFVHALKTHRAASSALQIGHTTSPYRLRAACPGGHAARPETRPASFNQAADMATRPQGPRTMREAPQLTCHPSRDLRPAGPHVHPRLQDPPGGVECPPDRSHHAVRPVARRLPWAVRPRATKHAPLTSAERPARATRPQGPRAMPEARQLTCHASRDPCPSSPHVRPRLQDPPGGVECPPDRSHHAALSVARRLPWRSGRAPRKQLPTLTGCP